MYVNLTHLNEQFWSRILTLRANSVINHEKLQGYTRLYLIEQCFKFNANVLMIAA